MAHDEASLSTDTDSMSLGLIWLRLTSTPSASTSGEPLLSEIEPRMLMA